MDLLFFGGGIYYPPIVTMANTAPGRKVRFGAYVVDFSSAELFKHGIRIKLQDQPFQILTMLLEKSGELVSREELRKNLWSDDTFVDFDAGLNAAVRKLRDALNESADEPRYIETLPRHGYRFIASVEAIPGPKVTVLETPTPIFGEEKRLAGVPLPSFPATGWSPEAVRSGGLQFRQSWLWASAILVGAILLAAVSMTNWRSRFFSTRASAGIQSIAVLPLQDLSGDSSQDYFADGMTDALITDLAQIKSLRVISRTSSMHYKGTKENLPQIAKELNVDAVIEGVVVRSGDRVRIDAQLIRADGDRHIWARRYDRKIGDILTLQGEVARTIAAEIVAKLTPQELTRLARVRTVDPSAYENYVQGLFYWNKRTSATLLKSVGYYENAIQIDPNYAEAYAGLAMSYDLLGHSAAAIMPEQVARPKAKAAALKALDLDPDSAEAHTALGYMLDQFEDNSEGAEREYKKAIELDPNYPTAYQWYSIKLDGKGQGHDALEMILHAQRLDPVSPNVAKVVGDTLADLGRYDEAKVQLEKAVELDPSHFNTRVALASVYFHMKMHSESIAQFEKAVELSGEAPFAETYLAQAYYKLGRAEDAEKILDNMKLQERTSTRSYSYLIAVVSASLGHYDDAMQWLEKACEVHSGGYKKFRQQPEFEPLYSDPRFVALERRMSYLNEPAGKIAGIPAAPQ